MLCVQKCAAAVCTNLVEQLDAANLLGDILREHGVASGALDLNFAVVRHDCDFWCRGTEGWGLVLSLRSENRTLLCVR